MESLGQLAGTRRSQGQRPQPGPCPAQAPRCPADYAALHEDTLGRDQRAKEPPSCASGECPVGQRTAQARWGRAGDSHEDRPAALQGSGLDASIGKGRVGHPKTSKRADLRPGTVTRGAPPDSLWGL